jgi:hypothetical protein
MFNLAFKNWDVNVFMWLGIFASGGICKGGNKPPIFINTGNFLYLKKYTSYVGSVKDSTAVCEVFLLLEFNTA